MLCTFNVFFTNISLRLHHNITGKVDKHRHNLVNIGNNFEIIARIQVGVERDLNENKLNPVLHIQKHDETFQGKSGITMCRILN